MLCVPHRDEARGRRAAVPSDGRRGTGPGHGPRHFHHTPPPPPSQAMSTPQSGNGPLTAAFCFTRPRYPHKSGPRQMKWLAWMPALGMQTTLPACSVSDLWPCSLLWCFCSGASWRARMRRRRRGRGAPVSLNGHVAAARMPRLLLRKDRRRDWDTSSPVCVIRTCTEHPGVIPAVLAAREARTEMPPSVCLRITKPRSRRILRVNSFRYQARNYLPK